MTYPSVRPRVATAWRKFACLVNRTIMHSVFSFVVPRDPSGLRWIDPAFTEEQRRVIRGCVKHFPDLDLSRVIVTYDWSVDGFGSFWYELREVKVAADLLADDRDLEFTVTHELRHAEQYLRGWLDNVGGLTWTPTGRWVSSTAVAGLSGEKYCRLPWEADANRFAHDAMGGYEPINDVMRHNVPNMADSVYKD